MNQIFDIRSNWKLRVKNSLSFYLTYPTTRCLILISPFLAEQNSLTMHCIYSKFQLFVILCRVFSLEIKFLLNIYETSLVHCARRERHTKYVVFKNLLFFIENYNDISSSKICLVCYPAYSHFL